MRSQPVARWSELSAGSALYASGKWPTGVVVRIDAATVTIRHRGRGARKSSNVTLSRDDAEHWMWSCEPAAEPVPKPTEKP
jgi:hypothetical protein